jgi:hypothetical protein
VTSGSTKKLFVGIHAAKNAPGLFKPQNDFVNNDWPPIRISWSEKEKPLVNTLVVNENYSPRNGETKMYQHLIDRYDRRRRAIRLAKCVTVGGPLLALLIVLASCGHRNDGAGDLWIGVKHVEKRL